MQYLLYPRLPGPMKDHRINEVSDAPIEALPDHELTEDDLNAYVYSATGGQRVTYGHVIELREALLVTGRNHGFPDPPGATARRRFDVAAGRLLVERMHMTANEAARPGLWPFICCDLVPELVRWRFTSTKEGRSPAERFSDGVRNTFGRLWWRTYVLEARDDGTLEEYGLQSKMGEDELVQLMERPAMRANNALTRTMAWQFASLVEENAGLPRMALMRDVQKRLNRLMPILCLEGIEQEMLEELVSQMLTESVTSLFDKAKERVGRQRLSWWERMVQRLRRPTTA